MIALLQRVTEAEVTVQGEALARIGHGVLALIGIERDDTSLEADRLAHRLLTLRLFDDADGRMNLDIAQAQGELLLVSQFTLAADTRKGRRPGFSTAAPPERAQPLFEAFVRRVRVSHPEAGTGRFGAHMRIALVNDGPVTFRLRVAPAAVSAASEGASATASDATPTCTLAGSQTPPESGS